MTKIDIISGFLGAGKTTLIKKLISDCFSGEQIVIIENEFGDIGIDGGFLKDSGIQITEMNSGCICCSLVGDFGKALNDVIEKYSPDRIIIEPSGVGKLSDVITAIKNLDSDKIKLNSFSTVVDAKKCKIYHKNFGEFFNNQIESAKTVILSHTDGISEDKLHTCTHIIKELNSKALIVTTPWDELTGIQLANAIESGSKEIITIIDEHEHPDNCSCGCHDHDHSEHHHEHHHEHHEHHHEHDEECTCGCHDHEHHHADEVFVSWGMQTSKKFTAEQIQIALEALIEDNKYGTVLRAKGIVASVDSKWIHFDYVPGEPDVKFGSADVTGKICVIGSKLNEAEIEKLFN